MNGTNLFKIALRALANNKLRAFLTMLGIIIGVASVITMLAIGQGSKKKHPAADFRDGIEHDYDSSGSRYAWRCPARPVCYADFEACRLRALRDETSFLSAISPNVSSSGQLIAGNNNYPASVNGVGTEYLDIRQLTVETERCSLKPTYRVRPKYV